MRMLRTAEVVSKNNPSKTVIVVDEVWLLMPWRNICKSTNNRFVHQVVRESTE